MAESYDKEFERFKWFEIVEHTINLARPNKTDVVVDLGAGTGAVLLAIAPQVKKVIAVDVSEKMLEVTKKSIRNW